jgi:hypothetical protein
MMPKRTTTWVVTLILIIGAGVAIFFLCRKNQITANVQITNTAAETNSELPTGQNVIQTRFGSVVVASSIEAGTAILEKARAWSADAELHSLSGMPKTALVDDEQAYYGYSEGKFATWIATVYAPGTKQSATAGWSDGIATLSEPYGGDDTVYEALESEIQSLNACIITGSSVAAHADAKEQGLDDAVNYYTMEMAGGTSSDVPAARPTCTWTVTERSVTELDEFGVGKTIRTYTVP